MPAVISAIAHYVPPRVRDNAELAARLGVTEDWIVGRTGIQERRIAESGGTSECHPTGQDVGRVGVLAGTGLEQAAALAGHQHLVEEELFGTTSGKTATELGEDGEVEAGVIELESQSVLPVDAASAARRSESSSASCITVTSASLQGASAGCPRLG
jgi:hypothetical protein